MLCDCGAVVISRPPHSGSFLIIGSTLRPGYNEVEPLLGRAHMSISDGTYKNLSEALKHLQLPSLTQAQAEQMLEFVGAQPLQILFAAAKARDNDAKVKLHQVVLSIKALYYLLEIGKKQATLDLVAKIVDERGYPSVRQVMVKAGEGDANALTILDQWLAKAAGQGGTSTHASSDPLDDEPLHATDVAPPATHERPSPTRQRAQAYRAGNEPGDAAPRTPATRAPASRAGSDNVASFPHGGSRDRFEDKEVDETSTRYAPSQGGSGPGASQASQRNYDQHSCFGKDVAVTFERTPNMARTNNTVNFKVAKAKHANRTCKEGVDWANGIIMMLEPHEVQLVYAVMMGFGSKFRAAGHGANNQKWFEVEETTGDWAGAVRLTVANGREDIRKVNISYTDLKEVLELFSRTLQDQAKGQSPVFMMAEVRRVYDLYAKKEAVKSNRQGGGRMANA